MGSTVNYQQITPSQLSATSTWVAMSTWVVATTSGAYFDVGDASQAVLLVANGSSNVDVMG